MLRMGSSPHLHARCGISAAGNLCGMGEKHLVLGSRGRGAGVAVRAAVPHSQDLAVTVTN